MAHHITYIKELNSNINIQILKYLYKSCNIVGKKILSNTSEVPIIQLDDYNRIWVLPEEIGIINKKIIKSR